MLEFVAKVTDNEEELLWRHPINLMDDLELLQPSYLRDYNPTSIAAVVKSPKQVCAMDEQLNNFALTGPAQMMHIILDEEEIYLHFMIKATLEQINTILQEQKLLQAWEEKMGQAFQLMTKVSKDLEEGENIVGQTKSSIEKIDRTITKAQNPSTCLFDIIYTTSATATNSIALAVHTQTLQTSTVLA